MDIIKCVIRGQRLSVNVPVMADLTVRYFNVSANFDSTWDRYTQRWVHIHKVTDLTIGSDWVLDAENKVASSEEIHLDTGEWEIWFHGVELDDNDDVYSRITTEIKYFRVLESGTDGGLMPSVPESNVEQITAIAQEALDVAESVEDRADSGEFNGATFTPAVSAEGIISWTNDKELPNPQSVDIKGPPGEGISVKGVVDDPSELPVSGSNGDTYLVGTQPPYEAYMWADGEWVDSGPITVGPKGDDGDAATIAVGTTTTLPAGSNASVTNSGTSSAAVFNFSIPQGANGVDGDDGAAATITVGTTSTLPAGSSATVTNSGTTSAAVFNFGIPQGAKGDDGEGVPSGGTVGQYLVKKSTTNYDAEWQTRPQIVNQNLLDNWYFVGGGSQLGHGVFPINQRSQTSYSSYGYTIDRWRIDADKTLTLNTQYISGVRLYQFQSSEFVKNLLGKTVTLSFLTDTELVSGTITLPNALPNSFTFYYAVENRLSIVLFPDGTPTQIFRIDGQNNLIAAKLELGNTQTLAHQESGSWVLNEIPDWGEQLNTCKFYFERLIGTPQYIGTGWCDISTGAVIWGPVYQKRINVSNANITMYGTFYIATPGHIGSSSTPVNSIADAMCGKAGEFFIAFRGGSGFTPGEICAAQIRDNTSYIDISADL